MQRDPAVDFSVADAAMACGVSVDTIRRRIRGDLANGKAPMDGPYRLDADDPKSEWRIPAAALVDAGLLSPTAAADPKGAVRISAAERRAAELEHGWPSRTSAWRQRRSAWRTAASSSRRLEHLMEIALPKAAA